MANKPKNTLSELNDILFAQLRKLSSAQDKEEVKQEIERTGAICQASAQVVATGSLALRATCIAEQVAVPDMLQLENNRSIDFGGLND